MSGLRIMASGSGLQPFVAGTLLARWCHGPGTAVSIARQAPVSSGQTQLLRPSFHRFHAEIGVTSEQLDRVGAMPAPLTIVADGLALPFEPYGLVRNGVDFHHHWLRAGKYGAFSDIASYSPSFALAALSRQMSCREAQQMPFATGLLVDAARYARLLEERFTALGGTIVDAGPDRQADLVFTATADCRASQWEGNAITIATPSAIPGTATHACLEAARRWLALAAMPGTSEPEEREFNRLGEAEAERIADMEELLASDSPETTARPALARKISVFKACGRIPSEDYEVFAPHEWLAALLARGFVPARHDRLADVIPERDLLDWLASLRRKLAPHGLAA